MRKQTSTSEIDLEKHDSRGRHHNMFIQKKERKKFRLRTIFRVFPRDFSDRNRVAIFGCLRCLNLLIPDQQARVNQTKAEQIYTSLIDLSAR